MSSASEIMGRRCTSGRTYKNGKVDNPGCCSLLYRVDAEGRDFNKDEPAWLCAHCDGPALRIE